MCGIVGFWSQGPALVDPCASLSRMTEAIRHRGPDDEGQWYDQREQLAFGHRRLSILDLSAEGHQPMESSDGRFVIIFNGEIYNFRDLRAGLNGRRISFRGHSDTEVMLAVIESRGLHEAVRSFSGMFAFALYDRKQRSLHLVRDRLGEKPLYYGWMDHSLLFGSELKALQRHPAWQGDIDRGALSVFLRHGYIPGPLSIYRGIHKVLPGTIVTFRPNAPREEPEIVEYWSARDAAEAGTSAPFQSDVPDVLDRMDALLREIVGREMVADVPLGAFLSGGIDSSLIVALMQAQSTNKVRTFTIGFNEPEFNEATFAKSVAEHLGTDHTELYVTPADALAVVPKLPTLYDEPFADPSQIPTYLVSELARRHVTVSLSGDGGDELFGGYSRYLVGRRLWRLLTTVPYPMRRMLARSIKMIQPGLWQAVIKPLQFVLPDRVGDGLSGHRVHRVADVVSVETAEAMYHDMMSHWRNPAAIVQGGIEPRTALTDDRRWAALEGILPRMMYLDMVSYLPDDILVKVDRASMGVSLESRAPFMDHRVVEFAWRIPDAMRMQAGAGKWILRQLLHRYVPRELVERPKMGFGVPIDSWIRGPLKEWAGDLLNESVLRDGGFFDPGAIRQKWDEHQAHERNWQYPLWNALMFQAWMQAQ